MSRPHQDTSSNSFNANLNSDTQNFINWERISRDTIDVKRVYIDIAEDIIAGILLSQIIYWFLPDFKTGKSKLTVEKEGYMWLVKEREDWWDECRLSPRQYDTAIKVLCKKGLIVKKVFQLNNRTPTHLRLDFEKLCEMVSLEFSKNNCGITQSVIPGSPIALIPTVYNKETILGLDIGACAPKRQKSVIPKIPKKEQPPQKTIVDPSLKDTEEIQQGTVTMSLQAYESLCNDFGEKAVQRKALYFSLQKVAKPKQYSQYTNHAAALRNWLTADKDKLKDEKPKGHFLHPEGAGTETFRPKTRLVIE